MGDDLERTVLPDGTIRMVTSTFTGLLKRVAPGHLLFAGFGIETASVRAMTMAEYEQEIAAAGSLTIYGDMRGTARVDSVGREAWGAFAKKHQAHTKRAVILVGSKVMEMAMSLIGLFVGNGKIRSVSDERVFVEEIARDVPGFKALPEVFRRAQKTG